MRNGARFTRMLLVLGVLVGLSDEAHAVNTVLLACGEDSCVTLVGSANTNTTSTFFRSAWARMALGVYSDAGAPPAARAVTPTFTATGGNVWVHTEFYSSAAAGTSNYWAMWLYSPDGVPRIVVRQTGTSGTLNVPAALRVETLRGSTRTR